jgi:uncharacterized protein YdbL (DUF1318 family)
MTRLFSLLMIGLVMTLAACVTINVYFPEAAAEEAADRFIQDVLGEDEAGAPETPAGSSQVSAPGFQISDLFMGRAWAQSPNIDVNTPQIQSIKARMAERHQAHLAAWFEAGAIGLSNDGLVEIRDRSAIGLADRRNLERVVGEENADRRAVYREIAVANGQPGWEDEIRQTFARRWIANARPGWFYQQADGTWTSK